LKYEAFEGNLYSDDWWLPSVYERDYENFEEFNKARVRQLEKQNGNRFYITKRLEKSELKYLFGVSHYGIDIFKDRKAGRCHYVRKSYGGIPHFVWIEGFTLEKEIGRVLSRLLYDSGIRYFWHGLKTHYESLRRNNTRKEETVVKLSIDERVTSVIILTGVVLSVGVLTFLWELKLVLKSLGRKYLMRLKKKIVKCKINRRKWRKNKIGLVVLKVKSEVS